MRAVTPSRDPLDAFGDLLDRERQERFHAGQVTLGLETMEALLGALGPLPEPEVAVHVAGSEGKTSTTELLGAALGAAGLSTGLYTSPHLRTPAERLRLGGHLPPHEALAAAVQEVLAAAARCPSPPSWFEALTATARVLFAQRACQAVVWETGLGGRLDATRLLPAHLCVITTVSLEHTQVLGDTLEEVAFEKAGILRPGVPVVVGSGVSGGALDVIAGRARELGCALHVVPVGEGSALTRNRVLAREACEVLWRQGLGGMARASREAGLRALQGARVEGREQRLGHWTFDGAHTVAAARQLASSHAWDEPTTLVFAATSGRSAEAMLSALGARAERVLLPRLDHPRGQDPEVLARSLRAEGHQAVEVCADPARAAARAREVTSGGGQVLVTGSLYLVGALLPQEPRGDPPR